MENPHILVVEDSEITLFKLKAILVRLGYKVTTYTSPLAALDWMSKPGGVPDLIISDVLMPDLNGYDFIRQVREKPLTAHTPVVMLTSQQEISDKLAGLQAGADDYLPKTVTPTELELRIKALLSRSQTTEGTFAQSAARTISVFSLRGGVGTTLVSINLAVALSQLWGIEATLWDMSPSAGACAFILNLKPKNTISTFANWPADAAIDDSVVAGLLIKHKSGIKLLPSPTTLEEAELITTTTINMIWPFLQSNSAYLVVDAGSRFNDPVIPILERSDIILLLLAPELVSVKAAYDAMQIFDKFGIDPSKIMLVVNNIFPEHPLLLEKIAVGLKKDISATIPYDSTAFIQNLNTGHPFILTTPRSEASLAILTLAYKLSSKDMESNKITRPSPFLETIRKIFTAG